jgi:chromate transporter
MFVVIPYPWFDRFSENPQVKAFVRGVTAAAAGAIAGACFVLARRAIVDLPTLLIGLVTLALLYRLKIPEPVLIISAGALGILIFWTRG